MRIEIAFFFSSTVRVPLRCAGLTEFIYISNIAGAWCEAIRFLFRYRHGAWKNLRLGFRHVGISHESSLNGSVQMCPLWCYYFRLHNVRWLTIRIRSNLNLFILNLYYIQYTLIYTWLKKTAKKVIGNNFFKTYQQPWQPWQKSVQISLTNHKLRLNY